MFTISLFPQKFLANSLSTLNDSLSKLNQVSFVKLVSISFYLLALELIYKDLGRLELAGKCDNELY